MSDERPDTGRRYLVAAAWSRAGGGAPSSAGGNANLVESATSAGLVSQVKLVAHSATLLPVRPSGAAELLIVALSRFVTLRPSEAGEGAIAAYVADGDIGLWLPLPWLLTPSALDEINGLRAGLSAALGADPSSAGGASAAAALQLGLIKMSVSPRPELSAAQAATAAQAAATSAPPPPDATPAVAPDVLLPPLEIAPAELFAVAAPAEADAKPDAVEDESLFMADDDYDALELLG